jgi:hypothetical protein
MKLNPLLSPFEWLGNRQAQRRQVKALNKLADERALERNKVTLKNEVHRLHNELWAAGFKVVKATACNDKVDLGTFYALTPNGRLVEIKVNLTGGFKIEEVMSK